MNITITPNTNPIDATVLNTENKSFASSGGSAGGVTNLYPANINLGGIENSAPVVVAPGFEVDLASFNMTFVGNKAALMLGFLSLAGASGLSAKFRFYVDGVKVSEASVTAAQVVTWGFFVAITPVGVKPVKVSVFNDGGVAVTANPTGVMMMEML